MMSSLEQNYLDTVIRSLPSIVKNLEKQNKILEAIAEEKTSQVSVNDMPEFIGQIIDIFEDFLTEKKVNIENPERKEAVEQNAFDSEENTAIIFGSDYDRLERELVDMMKNWKILQSD